MYGIAHGSGLTLSNICATLYGTIIVRSWHEFLSLHHSWWDGRLVRAMRRHAYSFRFRPPDTGHGFPFLVFDTQDELHFPLMTFGKGALRGRRTRETVQNYLYAILPFFTYLDHDVWQQRAGIRWDSPPEAIRTAVTDYLSQPLRCHVDPHPDGFQLVTTSASTPSNAHTFLSALKLFYRLLIAERFYAFTNPLINPKAAIYNELQAHIQNSDAFPAMPAESGMTLPRTFKRLTDSYFVFSDEWNPQTIDDPTFPQRLFAGGRQVGWRLREQVITLMLFDTGARLSEITGLTLGDYDARESPFEASTFNKGSRGKRTKWIRFHRDTAVLLERYFNTERRALDERHRTIEDYRRLARQRLLDLYDVPLFLSTHQQALSTDTYRDDYWKPACAAAGIRATPHQTRHWYVTMALREIHATATTAGALKEAQDRLVAYMHWRSGAEMLEVYGHAIRAEQHALVQQQLQERMHAALQADLAAVERGQAARQRAVRSQQQAQTVPTNPTLDFLYRLGGESDA